MWLVQYIPTETKFHFMRLRRVAFPFSAALSVLSVLLFFAWGMNFGIDFKGGTLVEMQSRAGAADIADIRARSGALGFGDAEVQQFGTAAGRLGPHRRCRKAASRRSRASSTGCARPLPINYEFRRVEVVGPRVSGELVQSGTLGVILAILGVLVYLWFRFEWQFAIGAVVATLHDLVLTMGFFALTQIEFNMTSIAAILTILGYSLNDTVVVYDRIREMMRKYKRLTTFELIDMSMNATLSRTIITGVSVFLALIALGDLRRRGHQGLRLRDAVRPRRRHLFVGVHRRADPDLSRAASPQRRRPRARTARSRSRPE